MANVSFCANISILGINSKHSNLSFEIHPLTVFLFLLAGQNAAWSSPRKCRTPAGLSSLTRISSWSGWNMSNRRPSLIWSWATSPVSSTFQGMSLHSLLGILILKPRLPVAFCAPSTSWSGKVRRTIVVLPALLHKCPFCEIVTVFLVLFIFVKILKSKLWRKNDVLFTVFICKYSFAVIADLFTIFFPIHTCSIVCRHVQTLSHILHHHFFSKAINTIDILFQTTIWQPKYGVIITW